VPALDLHDDPPRLITALIIDEGNNAVNAGVGALFLLADRVRPDEARRPVLELVTPVRFLVSQRPRTFNVRRFADDLRLDAEAIMQAVPHQIYSKVGNVYPNPFAVQLLRRDDRRPAPAERVEDNVTFVTACRYDTL
jgi:hypothetical protein